MQLSVPARSACGSACQWFIYNSIVNYCCTQLQLLMSLWQVFYTGTLEDGSVFDSNVDQDPLQFEIGAGKVIPGFDDAVTGLAEGEKRKQHVPADRAYGAVPSL